MTAFEHIPPESIDYAAASYQYSQEAQNPELSEMERLALQDIADFTAKRALQERIKQYMPKQSQEHREHTLQH